MDPTNYCTRSRRRVNSEQIRHPWTRAGPDNRLETCADLRSCAQVLPKRRDHRKGGAWRGGRPARVLRQRKAGPRRRTRCKNRLPAADTPTSVTQRFERCSKSPRASVSARLRAGIGVLIHDCCVLRLLRKLPSCRGSRSASSVDTTGSSIVRTQKTFPRVTSACLITERCIH